MREFSKELDSEYIIDGSRMEMTPRQILDEAAGCHSCGTEACGVEPIVDESVDPALETSPFRAAEIHDYLRVTTSSSAAPRNIPAFCPEEVTKTEIASALLETIWKSGHFRLDDLAVEISWEWALEPVGNMSSFYKSVSAACEYLDFLGVRLSGYSFRRGNCCRIHIKVKVNAAGSSSFTSDFPDMPFRTQNPELGTERKCPSEISEDKNNWLIYIPFDTAKFRLGGSLLSEVTGILGGRAPELMDSDYFIDCYEVVREFVEDGVVVSGVTSCRGGLMNALSELAGKNSGIQADLSGIIRSYGESDIVKILFGEIPGAVLEIKDSDFDYVDAEMLLQDVAYYPLGHPGGTGIDIVTGDSNNISGILQSLIGMQDMTPEGED